MPECQNCGSFVTRAYARVFTPNGMTNPRVCPECEDKIRDGAEVREAKGGRNGGNEPTKYDPKKDPTVDTTASGDTAKAGGSDV